jgi:hypothetical protein
MIISETATVTITNQGKYYASLGYGTHKQGTKLLVSVKHLLKNSNIRVECKCDECNKVFSRQYQLIMRQEIHRCNSCHRKYVGSINGAAERAAIRGKSYIGSNHPRWNPDKKAFAAYAYKVRRITEENYEKHIQLINPDNLPRTLCGVDCGYQLDHKISIKWAFSNGLNPKIVGSVDNLQMLSWIDNRQKMYK